MVDQDRAAPNRKRRSAFVDLTVDDADVPPVAKGAASVGKGRASSSATMVDLTELQLPPRSGRKRRRQPAAVYQETIRLDDSQSQEPLNGELCTPDLRSAPLHAPSVPVDPAGTFFCAVCYDDHPVQDCYISSMCKHKLCRTAARGVILAAVQSCAFPVLCPVCQAKGDPKCPHCERRLAAAAAQGDDAAAGGTWCCSLDADVPLLLTIEEEAQYLARSLKAALNSAADLVPCARPGCEGAAVAGKEDDTPRLVCNACRYNWCRSCKVAWHEGKSCDEHIREMGETEADKGMKAYEEANRVVHCPTCGHGIEKISGCNHVLCAGCKTHVCWLCGAKLPANNPYSHFTLRGCVAHGVPGQLAALQAAGNAAAIPHPAGAGAAAGVDAGFAAQVQQIIQGGRAGNLEALRRMMDRVMQVERRRQEHPEQAALRAAIALRGPGHIRTRPRQ